MRDVNYDMVRQITDAFYAIISKSYTKKKTSGNSPTVIYRMMELGTDFIISLMLAYAMYNDNDMTTPDGKNLTTYLSEKIDSMLYIYKCIYMNMTISDYYDFFKVLEFDKYEKSKPNPTLTSKNDMGIGICIDSSPIFNARGHNDVHISLMQAKRSKEIVAEIKYCLCEEMQFEYHTTLGYIEVDNRRKQDRRNSILNFIKEISESVIYSLHLYEMSIFNIRAEDKNALFINNIEEMYKGTEKFFDEDRIDVIGSETYSLNNLHTDSVSDLIYSFEECEETFESVRAAVIDNNVDTIVHILETLDLISEDKSVRIVVPENIKNNLRTLLSYRYKNNDGEQDYYVLNVSCLRMCSGDDKSRYVSFPKFALSDKHDNEINMGSVKDSNIVKCFNDISSWLDSELGKLGVYDAVELINGGDDEQDDDTDTEEKENTVQNTNEEDLLVDDSNIVGTAKIAILDENGDASYVKNMLESLRDFVGNTHSKRGHNHARRNDVLSIPNNKLVSLKLQGPLAYCKRMTYLLSKYFDAFASATCLDARDYKTLSESFFIFSNMSYYEYYDIKNTETYVKYSELFSGDQIIININYKDTLLDSMMVWYEEEFESFCSYRILDKMMSAPAKTKSWFKKSCGYDSAQGLNLNICSCVGICNVDITDIYDYIFNENNTRREISANLGNSHKERDYRLFEIVRYIWSILGTLFREKYIQAKNYSGEMYYNYVEYRIFMEKYNMSELIGRMEDFVKLPNSKEIFGKTEIDATIKTFEKYANGEFSEVPYSECKGLFVLVGVILPDGMYVCYSNGEVYAVKPDTKSLLNNFDAEGDTNFNRVFDVTVYGHRLLRIESVDISTDELAKEFLKILKYIRYSLD